MLIITEKDIKPVKILFDKIWEGSYKQLLYQTSNQVRNQVLIGVELFSRVVWVQGRNQIYANNGKRY